MSIDKSQQRDELLNTVRNALRRAERYCAGTRRWDTLLLLISIIGGAWPLFLPVARLLETNPPWTLSADGGFSVRWLHC
jgi:hypothetical protein